MQEKNSKTEDWKNENFPGKSELSWKKSDYEALGYEVPERLLSNPAKTEGELMTQEEIEAWIVDTFKTFSILKEENPEAFEKLNKDFVQDLEYLKGLGKVSDDIIENIKDIKNFEL